MEHYMTKTVAFIGLGNMGGPMATNLKRAGYHVRGFDLNPDSAKADGVEVAKSGIEAATNADVVITMLPAGRHVLSVWSDIIEVTGPGALLIDCSTIDVASARSAHELAAKAGRRSLDGPVSGGTAGAAAATLTFMVGGRREVFEEAGAIFEAMGKRIVYCGEDGAGQAAKICNNMILGITMAGVSEAFALGQRLGLSNQALFDVASTSSGQCWSLNSYCPVPGPVPSSPANNGYKPGFAVALMLKDLKLAQEASMLAGASTPLGAHAAQLYDLFDNLGHGGDDFSAIIKLFERGAEQHAASMTDA
jgi:3-hydroxyisobutyrate dehydrogenase